MVRIANLLNILINYIPKILLFLTLIACPTFASANEFGVNFYGFSYHPDEADSNGNRFHSWNPGAGGQYTFFKNDRHRFFVDGGIYRNSSAHASEYIAAGYRFRIFAGFEAGPLLAVYHSPDQNSGKVFIAPVLQFAYCYKWFSFQVVPVPKYKDVNRNASVGMYFTIRLWGGKP